MHEVKVELEYPVTMPNGETVAQLTMRRLKARDVVAAEAAVKTGESARGIYTMSLLCGVEPNVIEELDMSDFGRMQEIAQGFLSSKRKTAGA